MEPTKECGKCRRLLHINSFSKNKRYKTDGRENKCRDCFAKERALPGVKVAHKISRDNWKAKNPDYSKQYRIDNKEQEAARQADWYQTKKENDPDFMENNRKKTAEQRLKPEVQQRERTYNNEHIIEARINGLRAKDRKKGYLSDINPEYIIDISESQNGINLYTGTPICFTRSSDKKSKGDPWSSSMDRICSNIGHICGNIQIIELWLNKMKLDYSNKMFLRILRKIKCSEHLFMDLDYCPLDIMPYYIENNSPRCKFPEDIPVSANSKLQLLKMEMSDVIESLYQNCNSRHKAMTSDPIDFDQSYLMQLFKNQNYRCAITGISCNLFKNNPFKVSVDRKNSNLPYSKANIHLVCWCINSARCTMDLNNFCDRLSSLQWNLHLLDSTYELDQTILFKTIEM